MVGVGVGVTVVGVDEELVGVAVTVDVGRVGMSVVGSVGMSVVGSVGITVVGNVGITVIVEELGSCVVGVRVVVGVTVVGVRVVVGSTVVGVRVVIVSWPKARVKLEETIARTERNFVLCLEEVVGGE